MNHCVLKAGLCFLFCVYALSAQTTERLTLSDAITIAQKNNFSVLRLHKEIDIAEGRMLQAGRIPNPEIGVSWNESPNILSIGGANERDISLSQQIEFPTKRHYRINIASLDQQMVQLSLDRTKILITRQVKQSYYNLLLSESLIKNLEGQQLLLNDFQQLLNGRYQAGEHNYLDVMRAKIEITRIGNDIAEVKRERQVQEHTLNIILGREAGESVFLTDSLRYDYWAFNKDSLYESLIQKSVMMKFSRLSVNRQQESLLLAKASYLPDFEISLANQKRVEVNNFWGVEFKVSVPFWFWQGPKGQVQEATAMTDLAVTGQTDVQRQIRANFLNSLDVLHVAEDQLKVFDETLLMDAKDILSTAMSRYQNNQIDVLNLLDVYRTYRSTKTEYLRAIFNYAIAVTELEASAELPSVEN